MLEESITENPFHFIVSRQNIKLRISAENVRYGHPLVEVFVDDHMHNAQIQVELPLSALRSAVYELGDHWESYLVAKNNNL